MDDDDDVPLLNEDDDEQLLGTDDRPPTVEAVFVATFDVKYGRTARMSRFELDSNCSFRQHD